MVFEPRFKLSRPSTLLVVAFLALNSPNGLANAATINEPAEYSDVDKSANTYNEALEVGLRYTLTFLSGFQADILADNSTDCAIALATALTESGYSVMYWENVEINTFYNHVYYNAYTVGTYYSNATAYCISSYYNWLMYIDLRDREFENFVALLQSFSQNLIGKLFNIRELINTMTANLEEYDYEEFYYNMGYLLFIIQNFKPAEFLLVAVPDDPKISLGNHFNLKALMPQTKTKDTVAKKLRADITENSVYIFALAFWKASFNSDAPNSEVCQQQFYLIQELLEDFQTQNELYLLEDATQSMTDFVATMDPLVHSCVESTEEYAEVGIFYYYTLIEPKKILYNLIYDMGDIYDDILSIITLARKFNTLTNLEMTSFGTACGQLFNMIFFDPADFNTFEESRVE